MALITEAAGKREGNDMPKRTPSGEAGFALVLALLALMLLTTLGITLATTTSTEMQIATNFRWGLQAKYNAEAGIELGKRFLRQTEWRPILPAARNATDLSNGVEVSTLSDISSRTGPEGEDSRNFELEECDTWSYVGVGVVLDDQTQAFPFQNSSTLLGSTLNGTFTLWIKRPLAFAADGSLMDYGPDDKIVLTAEGTAPYRQGAATGAFQLRNRAVRYMQVELTKVDPTDCENRSGQAGSGAGGANFDNCNVMTDAGVGAGATETAASAGVQ